MNTFSWRVLIILKFDVTLTIEQDKKMAPNDLLTSNVKYLELGLVQVITHVEASKFGINKLRMYTIIIFFHWEMRKYEFLKHYRNIIKV